MDENTENNSSSEEQLYQETGLSSGIGGGGDFNHN
jgi:hypothetical protein